MLWWSAVAVAAIAGLILRVLAAQGGLWTDEAWSMIYAAQARDATGVFLRINHDNNHHLYSLWLQLVGMGAPPWLARLPAIIAGTLCIVAAALVAGSKSRTAAIVAAILFAVSPALVAFGAEARGYAMMLLAALAMLNVVTRGIERGWTRSTPWWLGFAAALGMLSHMTMAAPVGLVTLWVYFDRRGVEGSKQAFRTAVGLMGPATAATVAVVAFVFLAAATSSTGMRVGGYVPFSWSDYGKALDNISGTAIGLAAVPMWLRLLAIGVGVTIIAVRPPSWLGTRARLYALLIVGVPLAVLALRMGNASYARYYLTSLVGLFLLIAAAAGHALAKGGPARAVAAAVLLSFAALSLLEDLQLVRLQRGRPDGPIADMARLSPAGARLAANPRFEAIVTVAARWRHYPVQFVHGCEPADFVLVPRVAESATPAAFHYCGIAMQQLDSSRASPLTGDAWLLYGARDLAKHRTP